MAHRLESSFENYDSVAVKGKGEAEVISAPAIKACIVSGKGHAVAQLVALRYKPEGRGFDSRWCHWIFSLT